MTQYSYLFEAKSIQEYILRSGRLRHIVGASELIDSLTGPLLTDVLAALDLVDGDAVRFSRRAGGALYLFSPDRDARDRFDVLWSLAVRQYAPGLVFVSAAGEGGDDYQAYAVAKKALDACRSRQPPALPSGGPVTAYCARTGQPAVARNRKLGLQDAATARFGLDRFRPGGGLTERFAPEVPVDDWPRDLQVSDEPDGRRFPFLRDNRYLGLLHADGNGLGQLLMTLAEHAKSHPTDMVELFRDFSGAVGEATQAAARDATEEVLIPARRDQGAGPMPARPIVLGGDDLTILLRADLALPFARAFLRQFEDHSRTELARLRGRYPRVAGIPESLTAGGGIAFVRSNHPFHLAHDLAESLAAHAKTTAKKHKGEDGRVPPTLAFHRVTSASHGGYADILADEMTHGVGDERVRTTLGVYGLDDVAGHLPRLSDLEALVDLMAGDKVARGPARQILTLFGADQDDARRRYARWREVMREREPETERHIQSYLTALCGALRADLPVSAGRTPADTPLGDLATLLSVRAGGEEEETAGEDAA